MSSYKHQVNSAKHSKPVIVVVIVQAVKGQLTNVVNIWFLFNNHYAKLRSHQTLNAAVVLIALAIRDKGQRSKALRIAVILADLLA